VAWLWYPPPIVRPQFVTVERSFLPFLHLPGLVGVDGGVLSLLVVTPSAVDIYLLILGCIPPVPCILLTVDLCLIHTSLSPHLIRDLICGFPKLKVQPDWLVIWEGPDIGIGIQKVGAAAARSMWKPILHAILMAAAKSQPSYKIHVSVYGQFCAC